jgi:uroporphyrinogen III methyltransferase/synthase
VSLRRDCTLEAVNETSGIVYLVGAGPGDAGLITVRGLELIRVADVVAYDRLAPRALLRHAHPAAEIIYAGKGAGADSLTQQEINDLLVDRARAGKCVVRLKGGDPFVFGRGGEEAEALVDAGVRFEVVPGVTAGIAAPAYAGIPVTHRDEASAVALVTGHEDPAKDESALDWAALAAFPGTLVFYMGVRNLALLSERLIASGRSPEEPVAIVERGSLPTQRTVLATLADVAERASAEEIRPPAVTVVGPVAALRERLAWLERAPLHGQRVAVTRARAQASGLAETLARLGAEVIEVPAIRIEPRRAPEIDQAVRALAGGDFDLLCLTSPNGADLLMEALGRLGHDARTLAGVTIAAIGPGTAAALERSGLRADVVPSRSIAEELAEELERQGVSGKRVLIARASEARDVLQERLRRAGADVSIVALYDTVREPIDEDGRSALDGATYVTFTSSSTVRYLVEALGGVDRFPARARVVSIGPVTSATARELGLEVDVEAEHHDIDGLVTALVGDAIEAPARV